MKRAAIYLRISDDREGRELGVDDQLKHCRQLVRREGLTVVDVYRDNDLSASAKARKPRPDYKRLLSDAKKCRFDVIVALSTSRLTRKPRENEDLIELSVNYGIRYVFVKSPSFDLNTADGRMVARTLAAADAAEAERTAERVRFAVERRAEKTEYHGGPRGYGLSSDGKSIVEAEAAEIRKWYKTVLAGGSLLGIRTDLNRRGVLSINGKPWRAPVIRRILLNSRNAGIRILNGVEYPAANPKIVEPEIWRAARTILESRTGVSTARKHLGSGLYLCEREGRSVNCAYHKEGQLLYRCMSCFRSWRGERIDAWVIDLVADIIGQEDARERLLTRPTEGGVDLAALADEASAIRTNMGALAAEFATAKGATLAAIREGLRTAETRLAEIDAVLADAGRTDAVGAVLASDDPVKEWYDIEDVVRRQAVIRGLMTITLGAPLRGRVVWDPERFIRVKPRKP